MLHGIYIGTSSNKLSSSCANHSYVVHEDFFHKMAQKTTEKTLAKKVCRKTFTGGILEREPQHGS